MPNMISLLMEREVALRSEGKSERTISAELESLNRFAKWLSGKLNITDVADIRRQHVEMYSNYLHNNGDNEKGQGNKDSVRRLYLQRIRSLLNYAKGCDYITSNPMDGMKLPVAKNSEIQIPTDDEYTRMTKACAGNSFIQKRDLLILLLLGRVGLRRQEVINLTVADVDTKEGTAVIRQSKGGKTRTVALIGETHLAMIRYLGARESHRLAHTPKLILPARGDTFEHSALRRVLIARHEQASVVTPLHIHSLRHYAAATLKAKLIPDLFLMNHFGWSKKTGFDMLARYGAVAEKAQTVAVMKGVKF